MSLFTQNQGPHPKDSQPMNALILYEDPKPLNVLVFGPTGAGKSTIINHLTNNSANLPIGHELESCTVDITPVSVKHKGRLITFLDTPGFDDSDKSPAEHLALLMARLNEMHRLFKGQPHIHGVLYIHRITDNKMTKSAKMNIRVFQKLLGNHVLKNLVLVTNLWTIPHKDKHLRFEQSLMQKDEYFGAAIKKGARAGAAYRICEDATRAQVQETLLDVFLSASPEVLQIQQEMAASEVVEISSTEAGKVIREELRMAEHNLRTRLENLEKQLEYVSHEEREEREEISTDIRDLKAALNKLEDQDALLDADIAFLRQAIPDAIIQISAVTSAGAVASVVTEAVGAVAISELVSTVAGIAGGALVGVGILMLYTRWRNVKKK